MLIILQIIHRNDTLGGLSCNNSVFAFNTHGSEVADGADEEGEEEEEGDEEGDCGGNQVHENNRILVIRGSNKNRHNASKPEFGVRLQA